MLPSRSICTCTSCVAIVADEPPAALRVLEQPDASAAAAARITRAEILGMRVLLVGDPRPSNCRTKKTSAGRFGAHADLGGGVEGGDRDLAAEGSSRDGDRHLAMQVVMVALEYGVRLDVDLHVEVSRRAAVHAGLAFAREPHAVAFVDAGGDLHGERLLELDATTSGACAAWLRNDASRPVAARTSLRNRERTL